MNVDIAALRAIERDKDIPFETVIEAIETALLTAYRHTDGHQAHARDRRGPQDRRGAGARAGGRRRRRRRCRSGTTPRRASAGSPRPPRARSSCSGCATPSTSAPSASSPAKEGELIAGRRAARRAGQPARHGRGPGRRDRGRAAARRAGARRDLRARRADQVLRGRPCPRGMRGPQITLSRTHPNLVRRLFALEVPEIADGTVEISAVAREAGHRSKIAVRSTVPGVNAKGACIGPMGARVRNVMSELAGEKIDIIDYARGPGDVRRQCAVAGEGRLGHRCRRAGQDRAGRRARFPAVAGDRQGGAERPAGGPADRLADRHPQRRGPGGVADRSTALRGITRSRHEGCLVGLAPASRFGNSWAALTAPTSPGEPGEIDSDVGSTSRTGSAPRPSPNMCGLPRPDGGCRICCVWWSWTVTLVPDPRRRLPVEVRGCTPKPDCLRLAERRRAFPRALRVRGPLTVEQLAHRYLRRRCGPARGDRAGPPRGGKSREAGRPVMSQP